MNNWRGAGRALRLGGAALALAGITLGARSASAQEYERVLGGIALNSRSGAVLAKYGNPNEVIIGEVGVRGAPNQGGGQAGGGFGGGGDTDGGRGGFSGAPGGFSGGSGPGGFSGAPGGFGGGGGGIPGGAAKGGSFGGGPQAGGIGSSAPGGFGQAPGGFSGGSGPGAGFSGGSGPAGGFSGGGSYGQAPGGFGGGAPPPGAFGGGDTDGLGGGRGGFGGGPGGFGGGPGGGGSSIGQFGQTISTLARQQEVTWIYNRKINNNLVSYEFLIGPSGQVVQIRVSGYMGGNSRTRRGASLGSTYKDVVQKYGYPEEHYQVGRILVASYRNKAHAQFQFLMDRPQSNPMATGNKVVAITIATVE